MAKIYEKIASHIEDGHNAHHGVVEYEVSFRLLAIQWNEAYDLIFKELCD